VKRTTSAVFTSGYATYRCAGVRIKYGDLRLPRGDVSNCSTSALANSIALAGTLSFNGPSGSGRIWVVMDYDDLTGLKYLRILPTAMFE